MSDSTNSSKSTEMDGQMSFEDLTSDFEPVTLLEVVELVHALIAILQEHLEQNSVSTSDGSVRPQESASSDDLGHSESDR